MEQKQTTISKSVLASIEKDCVTPIARWHFVLKNSSFWALWGVTVIIGSCAVAASIFVFLNAGLAYRAITHDSFFGFFFDVIPLFWLLSIVLMVGIGYSTIRHTTRGYRFSYYLIVLASVVASFVGGTLLYTLGVAGDIDNIRGPLPFGQPIVTVEEKRWNDDARGLVSGVVKSYDHEAQLLTLMLFSGNETVLSTSELQDRDRALLGTNNRVRIIGAALVESGSVRVACAVLPWKIVGKSRSRLAPPPPLAPIGERKLAGERSSICKDVRPYQRYTQTIIQ